MIARSSSTSIGELARDDDAVEGEKADSSIGDVARVGDATTREAADLVAAATLSAMVLVNSARISATTSRSFWRR